MEIRFDGKTAVVTGAGSGLGRGIAYALADSGADIVVADINDADGEASCAKIREMGRKATFVHCDVSNMDEVNKLMDTPERLDILVNAAGMGGKSIKLLDATEEFIDRIVQINFMGANNVLRAALPRMIPNQAGRIVMISSLAPRLIGNANAHYAATKSAVISLAISAADTVAKDGITVNTILPGIVRTPMWEAALDRISAEQGRDREEVWQEFIKNLIPSGKPQTVEDIASAVLFLCSDFAGSITGQSLNICGDMVMRL